jgi:hypothetical protein
LLLTRLTLILAQISTFSDSFQVTIASTITHFVVIFIAGETLFIVALYFLSGSIVLKNDTSCHILALPNSDSGISNLIKIFAFSNIQS